jgi:hypothetical protein
MVDMFARLQRFLRLPPIWLGGLAALFYNSWPLAFVLNPVVGHHALASELEAPHQPYDWLFILMDVLTGLLIAVVGLLQLRSRKHSPTLFAAVGCYVVFGVFVAGAALIPLNCNPQAGVCGPLLHNPSIVAHGAMSILSVVSLLIGVILVSRALYQAGAARRLQALFAAISLCWVGFGLGSLSEMLLRIHDNNVLQDFFITVCSLSIALVVGGVEYLAKHMPQPVQEPEPIQNTSPGV